VKLTGSHTEIRENMGGENQWGALQINSLVLEPVSGCVHANYALALVPIWYAWSSIPCLLGYVYLVLCHHHLSEGLPPSLLVPFALVKFIFLQRFILSDFTRCPSHITVVAFTISIISGSLPTWYPSWVYLMCHMFSRESLLWVLSTYPHLCKCQTSTIRMGPVQVFVQFNPNCCHKDVILIVSF